MEEINPYVMESMPAVLSIGRRCMVHGYAFSWPANKSPFFTKTIGEKVYCDAHAYVPYLRHRDPTWEEGSVAAPANATKNAAVPIRHVQFTPVQEKTSGGDAPALPGTAEEGHFQPSGRKAHSPTAMPRVRGIPVTGPLPSATRRSPTRWLSSVV